MHVLGKIQKYDKSTASRHNLAQLGHKNIIFACFKHSFVGFFVLTYELTQAQVIKAFYKYKIKGINLLHSVLLGNNIIISPDESRGYIGFTSVAPLPYILTCVRDNSKMLSQISFKLGTQMYLGQERNPILR